MHPHPTYSGLRGQKHQHRYEQRGKLCELTLQTITMTVPKDEKGGIINNQTESWKFKYDKILHNSSQEDVFEFCAQEAVHSVVDGINATVMCYG